MRRALLLDDPCTCIDSVLSHLGYVQIDPINVCGRMHDLILRNRVTGYGEGDLMRHLHGDASPLQPADRTAFEHHEPRSNNLVAFPLEAWPYLIGAMERRSRMTGAWSGKLTPREGTLAKHILAEIAQRGPLSASAIADDRPARRIWGASTLVKATLQKLFFHGRVLISQRISQRRVYDLPERVLPDRLLSAKAPSPSDTERWIVIQKLCQRRLVALTRDELRHVGDLVVPIAIDQPSPSASVPTLYCLNGDLPWLEFAESGEPKPSGSVRLLAPLDPLIYDRRLTSAVWNFNYTWEAYTPPHKRIRGYYALPILSDLEIAGHIDAKADRKAGQFIVVSRRVRRGHRVAATAQQFARWLGVR